MKVLVACEESGVVRDAFIAAGHDAMSCDLGPTRRPGPHYQGDVRDVLHACWDLMIFHAPCTHICVSGSRHFEAKRLDGRQQAGVSFFMELWRHGERYVDKMAAEQPIGIMSSLFRKPDQIIQPWQFGHGETKATCLWLQGLQPLVPTNIVEGREARVHRMPPGPNRARERSATFQGIADAMAMQWGGFENSPLSYSKVCESDSKNQIGLLDESSNPMISLRNLAERTGLEPATPGVTGPVSE